jgi:Domain of unknown function (DUF4259)
MGTWGAGSFENDTAMDWASEVGSLTDIEAVLNSLAEHDTNTPIDADDAARLVAAAETVAILMGRVAADVPDELQARLAGLEASPQMRVNAEICLALVLENSELVDLWAEGEPAEWNLAMTGLINRLNPEVPFDPPPPLNEIEKRSGYITRCVFCDGEFTEGEIFNLEFRDYSNMDGLYVSRGIYCHLPCLNAKVHPRHLLQNWKCDPDEPAPFANLRES